MPDLPHHVVRDVHHVADRAQADRAQARRHPRGRRPHGHAGEHARGEAVAELRIIDADPRERMHVLAGLDRRDPRRAQRRARECGELARDPDHRETVRAVRRDLDLEHDVVEAEPAHEVGAERRVGAEREDAGVVLLAQSQLALGAQHALGRHAADLRRADRAMTGQHGPGRREGRPHPGRGVRRAADDAEALAAGAHAAQHETVPVTLAELPLDRFDLADHDALDVGGDRNKTPDLDTGVDEQLPRSLRCDLEIDELADPAIGNLHAKLTQEAQVVLEEQPQILDAVLQHRDPLDAHAERPARHFLGVVADVAQHVRVDHARAEDLQPSRLLAQAAAVADAHEAEDVDLRRRLRERKERRPEPDLRPRPEELAREELERALEIAHRDVAVHREALDLVEDRRVRGVRDVAAIDAAGNDHAHGRRLRLHRADLHGRRVGAQQQVAGQEERVLHVARGMVRREVQGLEVVVVGLDLRALDHGEAEPGEDLDDLVLHPAQRMGGAERRAAAGERQVGPRRRARSHALGLLCVGETRVHERFQLALGLVGRGAHLRPLGRGQRAERAEELGESALPAEVLDADLLELGGRPGGGDRLARLPGDRVDARVRHSSSWPSPRAWRRRRGRSSRDRRGSCGRARRRPS